MASLNLNKVVLAGHLTATPELRQTPNGVSVTSFSIAINRRFSRNAEGGQAQANVDFVNCVAWRNTAEFISKHFTKGRMIVIAGRLKTETWDDTSTGKKRKSTKIVAESVYFGDSLKNEGTTPGPTNSPVFPIPQDLKDDFNDDDGDLPF